MAALQLLQKVVDLGHSVQFPSLHHFIQFKVVFSVHGTQCWVITSQYSVIGSSKLPHYDIIPKGLARGFRLSLADNISPKGKTELHSDAMWYVREYLTSHIGEISILWVGFLLLMPPIGGIRWAKCAANLHGVGVVIIKIGINLPPVLWCVKQWIQIEPCGGQ